MTTGLHAGLVHSHDLQIVFLEDNEHDRGLVHRALRKAGFTCQFTYAATKEEFEAALARGGFELILSDYALPGYDGAAALALANKQHPDTPFIFLSGTMGEQQAIDSLKSGATDYVLKQRMERLVPAIQRALKETAGRRSRRQAEEALRESEQRFREMADNIREVFWSASLDGRQIHYVSPAYEQIWGRSLIELLANPSSWLETVWPEDRPRVTHALEQLAQGTPYHIEYRIPRADGHRWIEDRGYPVRNAHGRVERMVGVAVDITDRKQLEGQLMQAQKMEAIGQLAGGIAHDFNNTLTVINGYAKLMLDMGDQTLIAQERLRMIYTAGMRVGNLTRQLLLFSRKHAVNKDVLELNELIEEIAKMLGRLIGEDVNLELRLGPTPRFVTSDPSMLEQVLMNLAVNARDAMPGGGHLTIATELRSISAAAAAENPARRAGEFVCLSVRDTGNGIPPEILPRIFEPFFTTKAIGVGTGIGLATVFGIVQEHQGWIEVETAVGAGTCFQVFLPTVPLTEVAARVTFQEPFDRKGSETILLVEDEIMVREFAVAVLQHYGYRILQAGSGVQALETWKWHHARIALVITDLVMPDGVSGIDLARTLRAENPALKMILTSGYAHDIAAKIHALPKELPFLQKPYLPNTLARMVREALDTKEIVLTEQLQP
ncbi:MAG TPA: response regulator [Lacunisphaera sp.]|nr:response regulator [Lacunisphaera sp.]